MLCGAVAQEDDFEVPPSSEEEEEEMGATSSDDEGEGKSPLSPRPSSRGISLAEGSPQGLSMCGYPLIVLGKS